MEFRDFEYFIAAYELKSFTKAAGMLHLTQQGVSKTVAKLEKEFGTPLFIRERTSLRPTKFGDIFYEKARYLFEEYEKTMDTLKKSARETAELRIGFAANVMPALGVESFIMEFRQQHPAVDLKLSNWADYECEEALLGHKIDAAFSMGPFTSSRIRPALLVSESIHALVSAEHPYAEKETLTIEDLSGESLITIDSRSKGYAHLLSFFQEMKSHANIIFQSNDPITHLHMVEKQMGIALFPDHLKPVFEKNANVCILPITDIPRRDIFLIFEEQAFKSACVRQFIKFTTQFFENTLPP